MVAVKFSSITFKTKNALTPQFNDQLFVIATLTTVYSMHINFIEKRGDDYFWQATMVYDGSVV